MVSSLLGALLEGSEVKDGKTVATQTVNPDHTEKIENLTGASKGSAVMHEVLEAYIGAVDSPGAGTPTFADVGNNTANGKAYLDAHQGANATDPRHQDANSSASPDGKSIYVSKFPYSPNIPPSLNPEILLFKLP
jgi:hypothetical protein